MAANKHNNPVTPDELISLRRLHAEGKGRNEIARLMDRGLRTISVHAAKMNLSFDRTATEEATRARKADLDEKRVILADSFTDDALRLSEQVWEPTTIYNFGGKDNTYAYEDVPEPPAADKRQLMAAATSAAAQSLRLVPPMEGEGSGEVGSLLTTLFDRLRERHGDG